MIDDTTDTPDLQIEAPEIEATSAPEPDKLDALLTATLDKMDGTEGAPDESDTGRDELGRFKAKAPAAPEGTSATEATSAVASTSTETPTNATTDPKWTDGHFRGWSQEERAKFQTLPPEAQDLLMAKVQGTEAHYKVKDTEFGAFKSRAEPLLDVIQKREPYFNQLGIAPQEAVSRLVDTEATLRFGTYAQKTALLQQMANDYGIPVTVSEPDPYAADPTKPGSETYPVIHDLRQQLTRMQGELQSYRTQSETNAKAQQEQALRTFAESKAADGTPAHPFFEQVKDVMGSLMQTGKAQTIAQAYELAAKPITEAIAKQMEARVAATSKAQADAVAKARKALPVRSSGMAPGGTTKGVSLDSILASAFDQHGIH